MSYPETTSVQQIEFIEAAESDDITSLAGLMTLPAQRPGRNPLDPARLVYAKSWFGLGAAGAALGALGLRQLGWPVAAGAATLGATGLAYMRNFEPAHPALERITIQVPSLPAALDGLRIGHITDIHLGLPQCDENLDWAIEQMRREQPALLALTGDLIGLRSSISALPRLLSQLDAPLGTYAVPGNHDYWEGLADIHAALALAGIPLLLNQSVRLRWKGADFWVIGIDDIWDGRPDFARPLEGIPPGAVKVLLAHSPDMADNAAEHGFALQLSGHTHGGHLRLPLLGPFARPRFGARYVMGQYRVGDMALYVSRGIGGPPLRLLCRPEITIVTLRRG
jgi:uncharacterized protein